MMQTFPISFVLRLIFLKKQKLSIYFSFTNEHLNECNIFSTRRVILYFRATIFSGVLQETSARRLLAIKSLRVRLGLNVVSNCTMGIFSLIGQNIDPQANAQPKEANPGLQFIACDQTFWLCFPFPFRFFLLLSCHSLAGQQFHHLNSAFSFCGIK